MRTAEVYALDTSCLVRWLLWDNEAQAKVVDGYLRASARNLHVSDLAVAEVAWVLRGVYEFDEKLVEKFVRKIIEHKNINCNRALFSRVVEEMGKTPKVSFTDLCLAYYVDLSDAKNLLTFDKTLARRLPDLVRLVS